jgi:hypothetical protein
VVRTEVDELTARLGELAGHIHAATAELVELLGRLDEIGGWCDPGIRSLGHWASIYLGIDVHTATEHAKVGRQLAELPAIAAAAAAGELGWSKLRLLGRVAEPDTDQKWLAIARDLSVSLLGRVVGAYRCARDQDNPDRHRHHQERRGLWLFNQPDGLVRIFGLLEPDDAAVLRAALAAHGELLWRHDHDNHNDSAGDDPHGHSNDNGHDTAGGDDNGDSHETGATTHRGRTAHGGDKPASDNDRGDPVAHSHNGDGGRADSYDAAPGGAGGDSDRTDGDTTTRDGGAGDHDAASSGDNADTAGSPRARTGRPTPRRCRRRRRRRAG